MQFFGVTANVCENPKYNHEDVSVCFDDALYKERYVIERSNAWMDSFRTLLLCHETSAPSWKGWNYLAFAVLLLKKITNHKSLNEFNETNNGPTVFKLIKLDDNDFLKTVYNRNVEAGIAFVDKLNMAISLFLPKSNNIYGRIPLIPLV